MNIEADKLARTFLEIMYSIYPLDHPVFSSNSLVPRLKIPEWTSEQGRKAFDRAVENGWIEGRPSYNSHAYFLTDHGRAEIGA